jgi:hypothetical protein
MPTDQTLSAAAAAVLAEVAAQIRRVPDVAADLCVVSEARSVKRGRIGPASGEQRHEYRLADMDEDEFDMDILPLLEADGYSRTELPAPSPDALLVDVTRTGAEGPAGGVLLFTREPARLVKASLHPPQFKRLLRLLVVRVESEVLYGYVRGVPLPVKSTMRFETRGIGRFRIDQEHQMTARYVDCEPEEAAG